MRKALLIIDPQNDFMDSPNHKATLAVPGSYQDTLRLCEFIKQSPPEAIVVTLDTHNRYDISHALWWVDKDGKNPAPFTVISVADVESSKWKSYDNAEQEYSLFYVKQLASQGNYPLCIWPYHVIKGTKGHEVEENLKSVLDDWEQTSGQKVHYVTKGLNPRTEHYSALKAEVQLDDEGTHLNVSLIEMLKPFDKISIAGQAKSHCVAGSTMDLIENIGGSNISKIEILQDCMSSVPGFEVQGDAFIAKAQGRGAHVVNAKQNSTLRV